MFATSLALIAAAFTGRDRGTAFGIYGAVIGGAVAIGPLIGGAITSGIGWRWIFFVNVPIGVVAVFITFTQIAEVDGPARAPDRLGGFLTFSLQPLRTCLRARAGERSRLGQRHHRRPPRGGGRPHGGLLRQRALRGRPDAGPRPVQNPRLRRPVDHGLLPGRVDLRHVLVPDPLHPGQPRLRAPGRGRPLPSDDVAHLRRLLLCGAPDCPRAVTRCCWASGWSWWRVAFC